MGSAAAPWLDVECGGPTPLLTGGPDRPRRRFRNPKPSGASPLRLRSGSSRVLAFPHAQCGITIPHSTSNPARSEIGPYHIDQRRTPISAFSFSAFQRFPFRTPISVFQIFSLSAFSSDIPSIPLNPRHSPRKSICEGSVRSAVSLRRKVSRCSGHLPRPRIAVRCSSVP